MRRIIAWKQENGTKKKSKNIPEEIEVGPEEGKDIQEKEKNNEQRAKAKQEKNKRNTYLFHIEKICNKHIFKLKVEILAFKNLAKGTRGF